LESACTFSAEICVLQTILICKGWHYLDVNFPFSEKVNKITKLFGEMKSN